jgi:ParB-like chromosome segregation protein Spo0J
VLLATIVKKVAEGAPDSTAAAAVWSLDDLRSLERERVSELPRDGVKARQRRAEAWQGSFRDQAKARWQSQSEASHYTVERMAEQLMLEWTENFEKSSKSPALQIPSIFDRRAPCERSTAERVLKTVHSELWKTLRRKPPT